MSSVEEAKKVSITVRRYLCVHVCVHVCVCDAIDISKRMNVPSVYGLLIHPSTSLD